MIHDPFYQQIVVGLQGTLDPENFERCAADLLRTIYPGLVPVRGGCDGGMDGAIADCQGTAYPLVCTTAEDVIGNLRDSLGAYLNRGGKRRLAVAATSQELTPRRRENLEAAADEFGFTLVNVHDQADFANRLYRDPRWCLELLGLPHDPPPLSVFPRTCRPALTSSLVGRELDLAWLRETEGDLLLVGQPGIGKTFLLSELARSGDALFVVTDDPCHILAGLRHQQPSTLLISDAHLSLDLLAELRRLRRECGVAFRIVADCWPGDQLEVMRGLSLSASQVRVLDRLTREQIVEVIRACGIVGPNPLLHELVRQSEGRPGLTVTLCHLCRSEGVRTVALGDALCRDIRATFEPLVGRDATTLLAAFAVGGDYGMPMVTVAHELGITLLNVHTTASRLAAGGVLVEAGAGCLAVRPEALRHALVRDIFFNDLARLSIDGFLDRAPCLEAALRTVIGARDRGGRVSFDFLTDLLTSVPVRDETWAAFAALGAEESRWVLCHHADRLPAVAAVALHHAPEEAVLALLAAEARGNNGAARSSGDSLGLLRNWVQAAFPGTGKAVPRRELVLRLSLEWLSQGGSTRIALRAACLAITPDYDEWESDPGNHHRWNNRYGVVTPDEMAAIQALWPTLHDRLRSVRVDDWSPLQELVRSWGWPGRVRVPLEPNTVQLMVDFGRRLLCDLTEVARGRPGLLRWAADLAVVLKTDLPLVPDPEFLVLYPLREGTDRQAAYRDQEQAARDLALRLAGADPSLVAHRLVEWESELRSAEGRVWPGWSPFVCQEIANLINAPGSWVDAFIEAGAGADLVAPFLRRSAELREPGWDERLTRSLDLPLVQAAAVAVTLPMSEPPDHLLSRALNAAAGLPNLIRSLCTRGLLSEAVVAALLAHPNPVIAQAAAVGEWYASSRCVRPALRPAWRTAMLRSADDPNAECLTAEILTADPTLACEWLAARLREGARRLGDHDYPASSLYPILTTANRAALLDQLPPHSYHADEVVGKLVGDDLALYELLLSDTTHREYHLAPLYGLPQGHWVDKAVLAMDAGHDAEQIARAAFRRMDAMIGDQSVHEQAFVSAFAALEAHSDLRIRRVGEIGRGIAQSRLDRARAHERAEAIDAEW